MSEFNLPDHPHRRFNALTGDWVLVSPHRAKTSMAGTGRKGAINGCSNPHPHGQIWASKSIPVEPSKEDVRQKEYFEKHGSTLLNDYLEKELASGARILCQNEHFVALIPFWATWPFEAMIVSRKSAQNILAFDDSERTSLAAIYKSLTVMYDNLFEVSFPYSAGIHQAPTDEKDYPHWHFHMHFYPPLLRSATIRKFMVGYEQLATPQRDVTPETSAELLRSLPTTHYKQSS